MGDEYNYSQQQGGAQHGKGRQGGWGGYTQQYGYYPQQQCGDASPGGK